MEISYQNPATSLDFGQNRFRPIWPEFDQNG
jgi:hypothetical protein